MRKRKRQKQDVGGPETKKVKRGDSDRLEIHHINLRAHGDATVIAIWSSEEEKYTSLTLIDAGLDSSNNAALFQYLSRFRPPTKEGDTSKLVFDYLILSHYHADHFQGLQGGLGVGRTPFYAKQLIDLGGYQTDLWDNKIKDFLKTITESFIQKSTFLRRKNDINYQDAYKSVEDKLSNLLELKELNKETLLKHFIYNDNEKLMAYNELFKNNEGFKSLVDHTRDNTQPPKKRRKTTRTTTRTRGIQLGVKFKEFLEKLDNNQDLTKEVNKATETFVQNKIKEVLSDSNIDDVVNELKKHCQKSSNFNSKKLEKAIESLKSQLPSELQSLTSYFNNLANIKPHNFSEAIPKGADGANEKGLSGKVPDYISWIYENANNSIQPLKRSELIKSNFPTDLGKTITLGQVNKVPVTLRLIAGNGFVWKPDKNKENGTVRTDLGPGKKFQRYLYPEQIEDPVGKNKIKLKKSEQGINTLNANNASLAFLLEHGQFRYFTGGDTGGFDSSYVNHEDPIAASLQEYKGHVCAMKISHHGSEKSSNQRFLDTLKPTALFNSSAAMYKKFPTIKALERLKEIPLLYTGAPRRFFFTNLYDYGEGKMSKRFVKDNFVKENSVKEKEDIYDYGNQKDKSFKKKDLGTEWHSFVLVVADPDIKNKSVFNVRKADKNGQFVDKKEPVKYHTCQKTTPKVPTTPDQQLQYLIENPTAMSILNNEIVFGGEPKHKLLDLLKQVNWKELNLKLGATVQIALMDPENLNIIHQYIAQEYAPINAMFRGDLEELIELYVTGKPKNSDKTLPFTSWRTGLEEVLKDTTTVIPNELNEESKRKLVRDHIGYFISELLHRIVSIVQELQKKDVYEGNIKVESFEAIKGYINNESVVNELLRTIDSYKAEQNLYRRLHIDENKMKEFNAEGHWSEPAFASTSKIRAGAAKGNRAKSNTLLIILRSSSGVDISAIGQKKEKEVLFYPGTKFKIVQKIITLDSAPKYILYLVEDQSQSMDLG